MDMSINNTVKATLTALSLTLLAACGSDSATGPTAPSHSAKTVQDGFELTISTAKATYAFGEDIVIHANLKNVSGQDQELDFFRGRPARYSNVNVNVQDDTDFSVFAAGEGEYDQYTLKAGKSLHYEYTWNQDHRITRDPVDRDFYEIKASAGLEDGSALRFPNLSIELD